MHILAIKTSHTETPTQSHVAGRVKIETATFIVRTARNTRLFGSDSQ